MQLAYKIVNKSNVIIPSHFENKKKN